MDLQTQRWSVAERAYQDYEFPAAVSSANGWEDNGKNTLQRTVFLDIDPDENTVAYLYWVVFQEGSTVIDSMDCAPK